MFRFLLILVSGMLLCVRIHSTPSVVDSTAIYSRKASSMNTRNKITIQRPREGKDGDLLVLFLSRTDARLPKVLKGWDLAASCLKWSNNQAHCYTMEKCVKHRFEGNYCQYFEGNKEGKDDLGTVVFYRPFNSSQHNFTVVLPKHQAAWAILLTVRGVNKQSPVRDYTGVSRDGSRRSIFGSTTGKAGDLLLLSMAFDDAAHDAKDKVLRGVFRSSAKTAFEAPITTTKVDWINGVDEAGFVYSKILTKDGATGHFMTTGPGGPGDKDALISLVLRGEK